MTALASADTCPVCCADHERLDMFWACPDHGHKLTVLRTEGAHQIRRCPVRKCGYTKTAPLPPRSPSRGDPMTAAQGRPSAAIDQMFERAAHLQQLLPPEADLASFTGSVQAMLYQDAKLMAAADAYPDSLMIALTECAALGHIPGPKAYHLTVRSGRIRGVEDYRGIVKRIYNSGLVEKVIWREVCQRDYFDFMEGRDEYPQHRFGNSSDRTGAGFFGSEGSVHRGDMVGVYAYSKLIGGGYTRVALLSREDVYAARASGGWKASDEYNPWNRLDGGPDHPEFRGRSMWWKTALKRSEPATPTSTVDKRLLLAGGEARAAIAAPERPVAALSSAPAPAPAVANGKRQALPAGRQKPAQRRQRSEPAREAPKRDDVVGKALRAAIGQQFDKLGLEDGDERDNYIHRLARKERGEDLAPDDLRGVLSDLGELSEGATVEDLQKLCNSIEGDDTEYLAELAGEAS